MGFEKENKTNTRVQSGPTPPYTIFTPLDWPLLRSPLRDREADHTRVYISAGTNYGVDESRWNTKVQSS